MIPLRTEKPETDSHVSIRSRSPGPDRALAWLTPSEWRNQLLNHRDLLTPFCEAFRDRRCRHVPHPVYDFLFTYYRFSSTQLQEWHPGVGIVLENDGSIEAHHLKSHRLYLENYNQDGRGGFMIEHERMPSSIKRQAKWVQALCAKILERPHRYGCFGLHEWAMVYRSPTIRHAYPLRLTPQEIDATVESLKISCSHFDAFRFFTIPARPLNMLQPTLDDRLELEQGGCLHANMDLYKWAYKLTPWISMNLVRECFLLAKEARELDMRASPYDLSKLGFEAIPIEREAGRLVYDEMQRKIAVQATELRHKLLLASNKLLAWAAIESTP